MLLPTQNSQTFLPLITLDAGLLTAAFNAKAGITGNPVTRQPPANLRGPSVIPPWQAQTDTRTLDSRLKEARDIEKFIDLEHPTVEKAGSDKDSRTLFALFRALEAMKSLAEFAAADSTPAASLARLDSKFQKGMGEVRSFLSEPDLGRLRLFLGDKNDDQVSHAGIGKDTTDFTGKIIQTGSLDDPLDGVAGNEQFKIVITEDGASEEILVDLSTITGPVSLNAVVDTVNAAIEAVPKLDENGDPVLDTNGDPISRYSSRFEVFTNGDFDHAIRINEGASESVSLVPVTAEPALFVTGTLRGFNDDFETTRINRIDGIDGAATSRTELASLESTNLNAERVAELSEAEDAETGTRTTGRKVAVDSQGFIYVLGEAEGGFGSEVNTAESQDVFLTKLDSAGNVIHSRLMGASGSAEGFALAIDADDNVIIAGQSDSELDGTGFLSGKDSFVAKFNTNGDEIFRQQLDTVAADAALSLTTDANGDIIVGGYSDGALNSTSGFGGQRDGMLLKLSGADGAVQSSRLIGGAGVESAKSVALGADGNLLVALEEDGKAVIRKYDINDLSVELSSFEVGDLAGGSIAGLAVDGNDIYLAGSTSNPSLDAGSGTITGDPRGDRDAFVTRLEDNGAGFSAQFTAYVGAIGTEAVSDVTAAGGRVYIAGSTTGSLQGEAKAGFADAFAAGIDGATGAVAFREQYGQILGEAGAGGLAFAGTGKSVLDALGLPSGAVSHTETRDIVSQSSVRDGDHFFVRINGGAKRKITIEAGDTFERLARKLNVLDLKNIKASTTTEDGLTKIRIKAVNGSEIELVSGTGERDALSRLGMESGKLLSSELLFNVDRTPGELTEGDLGGTFALGLLDGFHLQNKTTAKFVLTRLEDGIETLKRAFRSLSFSQFDLQEKDNFVSGPAPAHIADRIANFQLALNRLQSSNQSGTGGLLI